MGKNSGSICGLICGEIKMNSIVAKIFAILFVAIFCFVLGEICILYCRNEENILYILRYHFYKKYYRLKYGNRKIPFDKIHIEIQINVTRNLRYLIPTVNSYKYSGTILAKIYGARMSHNFYCYQIEIRNRRIRYDSVSHQDHLLLEIPNLIRDIALHITLDAVWQYDFPYHPWSRNNGIRIDQTYAQLVDIHIKKKDGEYYFRYRFDPLLYVRRDKELISIYSR